MNIDDQINFQEKKDKKLKIATWLIFSLSCFMWLLLYISWISVAFSNNYITGFWSFPEELLKTLGLNNEFALFIISSYFISLIIYTSYIILAIIGHKRDVHSAWFILIPTLLFTSIIIIYIFIIGLILFLFFGLIFFGSNKKQRISGKIDKIKNYETKKVFKNLLNKTNNDKELDDIEKFIDKVNKENK